MQRVTSMLPTWDRTKTSSKKGFDKAYGVVDKLGAPINQLSNKIGSETFWPATLDKESDKAARILKSFCKDGFYAGEDRPATEGVPKGRQRVLKKIPEQVIQNAVGLAIFTTMRTGLWVSGAGGSGILIARKEDGEWSPPSGIMLHTAGLGFLVGVDIYDCVLVINNRKALDAFTKIRATLGGEISAVAGPAGIGGVSENDGKWKQANRPVFAYLKARGLYSGVRVDGTVIIERTDENERFYGQRLGVSDILAGKAGQPPYEVKVLMETIKAAEGRTDVDRSVMEKLDNQPAPADLEIESPTASSPTFGVPKPDDPDPFGVLALEKIGLEIREAGSNDRPLTTQFEFHPSPTSPLYSQFFRRSLDSRSNRESYMSTRSSRTTDRYYQTAEMATQTDDSPNTSPTWSAPRILEEEENQSPIPIEVEEVDYTQIDMGAYNKLMNPAPPSEDLDGTTINESPRGRERSNSIDTSFDTDDGDDEDDEDDEDDDEPVIFEAASAQATVITPQVIKARGGLVDIPKRPPPPPVPMRSTARTSKVMIDQASGQSPSKEGFEEVDLHAVDKAQPETKSIPSQPKLELRETKTADSRTEAEIRKDEEYCQNTSFERKLADELEIQNLDDITPFTDLASPPAIERMQDLRGSEKQVGNGKKEVCGLPAVNGTSERDSVVDENEEFHSLPPTPGEISVK